jgi:sporulation protein YlmC with PRC-barrel domain
MAAQTASNALFKLSDRPLRIADRREDVRGRKVVDESGGSVGKVTDLFIDECEQRVRLLQVNAGGGFLGLGETKLLIPMELVTEVSDESVRINQSRKRIARAPRYDPALAGESHYGEVYSYYGCTPSWPGGYVYRPFVGYSR